MEKIFGGVEAGGTKFVCVAGPSINRIESEIRFPTTSPQETIQRVVDFFKPFQARGELAAIGIGSFGPVDLDKKSALYGFITTTPKPGWQNTDLVGTIQKALHVPVTFDTDVNTAAYGELMATPDGDQLNPFVYITVGTGIGVGIIANGEPVHGLVHTEGGHILLPHDKEVDPFPGTCPYHQDCWEGLASGPALKARWGTAGQDLPDDHPGWQLEAHYIALAIANIIMLYSPHRIVLGGGVAQHCGLIEMVRSDVLRILNGYVRSPVLLENIDGYIVPPSLGNQSGGIGAIAMAKQYLSRHPLEGKVH
jgi:fructokinase